MKNIKTDLINFIKNYVENAHSKGVVVGMSGGKDSFVTAKLCTLALGESKVFGVIMPNGEMKDLEIAKSECELLGIKYKIINIKNMYDNVVKNSLEATGVQTLSEVSTTNISPRLRMTMLYSIGGTLNYLVVGTSNLSETMIGYSTKWGDSACDFAPLAGLTKTEVCKLGLELGLPEEYVNKTPEDGLGVLTDEEKIGFSYAELDEFIRNGKISTNHDKILRMHNISNHKRNIPTKFDAKIKNHFEENKKR